MSQSARYQVSHSTLYRYSSSVAVCHNQLRMLPRNFPGVQTHSYDVQISPTPTWQSQHVDYYGNEVLTFAIESLHKQLRVTVHSDVSIEPPLERASVGLPWRDVQRARWDGDPQTLAAREFCYESPLVTLSEAFADYARVSFDKHADFLNAIADLTTRIRTDFRYDTRATHVATKSAEAFALRAGVCQDFAHVQIGCLRSLGFAARYVSGYLRTIPRAGQEELVGADESHAWISVYAGPSWGWIDCDPTNACFVKTDHVPICIGRDYRDVSPMRGVAIGGGRTNLSVNVSVKAVG